MQAGQTLGVVQDAFVQITAMDVQRACLGLHGRDDHGIGMPHARHVVVHVHVPFPGCVDEPDALAADDMHGLGIEERHPLAEQPFAAFEKFGIHGGDDLR